jgi:hypothetical protein
MSTENEVTALRLDVFGATNLESRAPEEERTKAVTYVYFEHARATGKIKPWAYPISSISLFMTGLSLQEPVGIGAIREEGVNECFRPLRSVLAPS